MGYGAVAISAGGGSGVCAPPVAELSSYSIDRALSILPILFPIGLHSELVLNVVTRVNSRWFWLVSSIYLLYGQLWISLPPFLFIEKVMGLFANAY